MPKIDCTCFICGEHFTKWPSDIKSANVCCGKVCLGISQRTSIQIPCTQCGRLVTRCPSQIIGRHAIQRRTFCNNVCQGAYQIATHRRSKSYVHTADPATGKQVPQHRLIMQQHLRRKLLRSEDVHHVDRDKRNNRIDNLEVLTKSAHRLEHTVLSWDIEAAKALYAKGLTLDRIAKNFGVSKDNIKRAFRVRGITRCLAEF